MANERATLAKERADRAILFGVFSWGILWPWCEDAAAMVFVVAMVIAAVMHGD
jgi:hypothetical protein